MSSVSDLHPEEYTLEFLNERRIGDLAKRMGILVTEFSEAHIIATMPVEGNTQAFGIMHGGAYVVLGELLGSIHANMFAPEGKFAVGVDVNATHTASANQGLVTAVCAPVHLGNSMTVHDIAITDADGKRCSTVRITNFYRPLL
ncbi:MAG: hotdog fold thioesterase [Microbacteriaceae bacterium]|nr:hotdog fold thioesterase [Microbacteriaceae bacterium]